MSVLLHIKPTNSVQLSQNIVFRRIPTSPMTFLLFSHLASNSIQYSVSVVFQLYTQYHQVRRMLKSLSSPGEKTLMFWRFPYGSGSEQLRVTLRRNVPVVHFSMVPELCHHNLSPEEQSSSRYSGTYNVDFTISVILGNEKKGPSRRALREDATQLFFTSFFPPFLGYFA